MKRRIGILLYLIVFIFNITLLVSCEIKGETSYKEEYKPMPNLEWDGRFLYHYNEPDNYSDVGYYSIVGMCENFGERSSERIEVLYVPFQYNGKKVLFVTKEFLKNNRWRVYGVNLLNVKRVYFSYITNSNKFWVFHSNAKETYLCNADGLGYLKNLSFVYEKPILYFSKVDYEKKMDYYYFYADGIFSEKKNDYVFLYYTVDCIITCTIANTAYMFNYEDSPNENYFFINNFERGGKIENTPYEPIRDGYTFTGWYKDEECTQKWNFETDTLPKWEYDEDGNEIFVETKLYAGWSKK